MPGVAGHHFPVFRQNMPDGFTASHLRLASGDCEEDGGNIPAVSEKKNTKRSY